MFRKWFSRKQPKDPLNPAAGEETVGGPIIASLLLDTDTFDLVAAEKAIRAERPMGLEPAAIDVAKEGILSLQVGDEWLFVAPMPVPYPWGDLEGPCQTAWMWPRERPAMSLKDHRSHVLVTIVKGDRDQVSRRLVLTKVMAALATLPGVAGVYWPDATMVHEPKIFAEFAKVASREEPPVYLWVDLRLFKNDDGTFGLFTTGLAALGLMEIEIPSIAMQPGELREWCANIALYLINRRSPIPDGDTIGATKEQQLKVRHVASAFGHEGLVIRFG
jgi:hypothetical protein